mgnify:CR=1 FL=1
MTSKKILIVDTQAGNLFSLRAAIERLGFRAIILDEPNDDIFDGIVIPGQGRFGRVMQSVRDKGWVSYLKQARLNEIPILGICVGMQIFFEFSDEDKNVKGLAWFKGKVEALNFPKRPMVGWARLDSQTWSNSSVYFVNSFAVKQSSYSIASTCYGERFCAAVKQGFFTGVQFHPEKSGEVGSQIIERALNVKGDKK